MVGAHPSPRAGPCSRPVFTVISGPGLVLVSLGMTEPLGQTRKGPHPRGLQTRPSPATSAFPWALAPCSVYAAPPRAGPSQTPPSPAPASIQQTLAENPTLPLPRSKDVARGAELSRSPVAHGDPRLETGTPEVASSPHPCFSCLLPFIKAPVHTGSSCSPTAGRGWGLTGPQRAQVRTGPWGRGPPCQRRCVTSRSSRSQGALCTCCPEDPQVIPDKWGPRSLRHSSGSGSEEPARGQNLPGGSDGTLTSSDFRNLGRNLSSSRCGLEGTGSPVGARTLSGLAFGEAGSCKQGNGGFSQGIPVM